MKNFLFLILIGFSFNLVQSQEIQDALRFSQDNLNGTARFRAMGGAFGALGGDLSSINVNPAGSAIFVNNELTISLSTFNKKNDSNYFETKTSDSNSSFDMNQTGGVFVFKNNNPSSPWKKLAFAINYENTNNFDNSIFSAGVNTRSVANYFLSHANFGNGKAPVPQEFVRTNTGESISDLYSYLGSSLPDNQHPNLSGFAAQQAMLGYQGYIINAMDDTNANSRYISNVTPGVNYYQENNTYASGYNGKLSFNIATSNENKFYIGANLNSHFTDYTRNTSFYESNNNPLNSNYTVTNLRFDNNLHTYGTGFSFQIGAIAKVTNEIRLGLSYDSPIWYKLSDEFSQKLVAVSASTAGKLAPDTVDPQIINYYDPYKLTTPSKITGSFAYVFGKQGLISIDYAIKDYKNTKFVPEYDSYYSILNNEMKSTLKSSGELRIGAEYKINEWSLRGGYRFEESPYKDKTTIGDLNSISGGFGYNFGMFKVDLAYTNAQRSNQQPFFNQGFTDAAKIKSTNNDFTLTLLFEM